MGEFPPLTGEADDEQASPDDNKSASSKSESAWNDVVSEDLSPITSSASTAILQILLNSFILTHLIDGLIHVLVPSTAIQFLSFYPQALYRRSQGVLSLSLAFLCFGIRQTLRGKASLASVFMLSLTLYCLASLSNLILSIAFDGNLVLRGYLWVNLVVHTFWVVGLAWCRRIGTEIHFSATE